MQELQSIGAKEVQPTAGGVLFQSSRECLHRSNLELGLASQVLVRLGEFGAKGLDELVKKSGRIPWQDYLHPDVPVAVKASCRKSRLYHSGAVEQRIREGMALKLGTLKLDSEQAAADETDDGEQPVQVRARIFDNQCTLSLDISGQALHRRNWRLQSGKAPLREDLARALLLVSGWDQRSPLLDPMMGSGTIVIEAATMARNMAPGRLRSNALTHTRLFDAKLWQEVQAKAEARILPALDFPILGSDRDAGALEIAQANAQRAGVDENLSLSEASLGAAEFPESQSGALVTNPPYGQRMGKTHSLQNLYQSLGKLIASLPSTWQLGILVADRRMAMKTGVPLKTALLCDSGGTKVRAMIRKQAETREQPEVEEQPEVKEQPKVEEQPEVKE